MSIVIDKKTEVAQKHRVFVYGTLKRGQSAHSFLEASPQIITGVSTLGILRPSAGVANSFPCFVKDSICRVYGEIYEIDDRVLSHLDRYEGIDSGLYTREKVDTGYGPAWIYVWGEKEPIKDDTLCVQYGRWSRECRLVPYVQLRQHYEEQAAMMERCIATGGGQDDYTGGKIIVPSSWEVHKPTMIKEVRPATEIPIKMVLE